jgi:acetoacetyl-CoA synthetase
MNTTPPLWKPGKNLVEQSVLKKYMDWLFVKKGLYFRDYANLWEWSVTDTEDFWESIWQFFSIKSHDTYFEVISKPGSGMIGTGWFSKSTLNYAEHVFRNKTNEHPALIFQSETQGLTELSWDDLEKDVAAVATWLRKRGIRYGDRIAAVISNSPQAVIAFLAANSIGAIWSSCSPDFGKTGIVDRFKQIEPKVLFILDGYSYNGNWFDKSDLAVELKNELSSLKEIAVIPGDTARVTEPTQFTSWDDLLHIPNPTLEFEPVAFNHPIWILYSSGTTGIPKAITHSAGGCLLEHYKALALHQNVKAGDRYLWYSTTGWMMWNYALSSLLVGATLVLYDGSVSYPDLQVLWTLVDKAKVNHFGSGAAFFAACMKEGLRVPSDRLKHLSTIGATGSPLSPETYRWIYQNIKKDVWLISLSGGTDVCSAFVGGCPLLPVYAGEIQCRMLGSKVEAFDENGSPVINEVGEMVLTQPMPSMPLYFWNDPDNNRYHSSYFEHYPGTWRHGDWIKITPSGSVIIYGRSDTTLNRGGVRIGTAEVYRVLETVAYLRDSLVVYVEQNDGGGIMPLFVVTEDGQHLTDAQKEEIKRTLKEQCSPRHAPDAIYEIGAIPYTINGKKMETPVKQLLQGKAISTAAHFATVRNPEALGFFQTFYDSIWQQKTTLLANT